MRERGDLGEVVADEDERLLAEADRLAHCININVKINIILCYIYT